MNVEHEKAIVWIPDYASGRRIADRYPYVREGIVYSARRAGPPTFEMDGTLVGYAVLGHEAPANQEGRFERRIFWVKSYDPYDVGPSEAIDIDEVVIGHSARFRYRPCWCVTCVGVNPRSTRKLHRQLVRSRRG